jgi:carboxylate-amine ligase
VFQAPIDLRAARERFDASTDFTVGIEEEFALLDPVTFDLVPAFERLRDAADLDEPALAESISGELISSEIEIRSGRGADLQQALARQAGHRRRLVDLATANGVRLGATGTHPWADYREQQIIDTPHYREVRRSLQYVARRNNTFSLHVHVGVQGADRAVAVCDRLRSVLPTLLAISANSPYVDGENSGLHSARTQTFTKSFPRCGIPDLFGDWAAYRAYVEWLMKVGSIEEFTQIWWSVRPHFAFGTVEVRICDAQQTSHEADNLIAIVAACVAQAAIDEDEGRDRFDPPARVIEENLWRAIRFGMDGRLIDLRAGVERAATAAAEALLVDIRQGCEATGASPSIPHANGAQRQIAAVRSGVGRNEIFEATVAATMKSYGGVVAPVTDAAPGVRVQAAPGFG